MDDKQIIELQQENIRYQKAEIAKLKEELAAAYQITVKLAQAVNRHDFGSAPSLFAAEQSFKRVLNKHGLTTNYKFVHEMLKDKS